MVQDFGWLTPDLLESITEGFVFLDRERRYVYVNEAAVELLRKPREELLGRFVWDVFPTPPPPFREALDRAWETGIPTHVAALNVRRGVWYEVHTYPSQQGLTVLFRDATEQKRMETALAESEARFRVMADELRTLNESLEERVWDRTEALSHANEQLEQRNRELQDFAYVASHDLQEPLRKLRTFLGLLEAELPKPGPEVLDYIRRMQSAATRMSQFITDLLELSRVNTRSKSFRRIDLRRVVDEVTTDLEVSLAEAGGRIEVGHLGTIEADPVQMRQLFQNLIGNAVKFRRPDVPPVVKISANTAALPDEAAPAAGKNGADARQAMHQIIVQDNGIGFDEQYADRIFQPFQRLHGRSMYAGSGVGLAICRRIAERHGGHISVRSQIGAGSTFVVLLPVRQPT